MLTYRVSTDGKKYHEFSEMAEIQEDIKQLQKGEGNIIVVENSPSINGVSAIQADGVKLWKGIFKKRNVRIEHAIEVLIGHGTQTEKIYRTTTESYDEVYQLFEAYIKFQKVPDYSLWEDITGILGG